MPRVAWLTDIHLDFLTDDGIDGFGAAVADASPDLVAITGDISVAPVLPGHLRRLADACDRPLYFVLGNHDYYGGDVETVRAGMRRLGELDERLTWMGATEVVPVGGTAMVGVDGWADGRHGRALETPIQFNDFVHIADLAERTRPSLVDKLNALGDAEAARARTVLESALAAADDVLFLTHVPPFPEACHYRGEVMTNEDWLPWLTCKAVGDVLLDLAAGNSDKRITVLCGHTHGAGVYEAAPNLEVRVGAAEYGAPTIQTVLDLPS